MTLAEQAIPVLTKSKPLGEASAPFFFFLHCLNYYSCCKDHWFKYTTLKIARNKDMAIMNQYCTMELRFRLPGGKLQP